MPPARLTAGRVGRPHGLDGSFHVVQPRPALLLLGAPVQVGTLATEIERRAGTDDRPILRLTCARTREGVDALRGQELTVPASAAPPLEEDEWYAEDLEGLRVADGPLAVGTVRRLLALPSCEVLEVERPDAGDLLVPLVRDAVRTIDLDAGLVDIDLTFLGEED